jgi:nicotinate-nucleotide adenylyltransferase
MAQGKSGPEARAGEKDKEQAPYPLTYTPCPNLIRGCPHGAVVALGDIACAGWVGGVGGGQGPQAPGPSPTKRAKRKITRLGLFGGTFNPVHYGHLRTAEEVAEALRLSQLWFIPAALPPHKASKGVTPFEIRLEMARLAVGRHPLLKVSDLEARRPGKSFTIQTLRILREQFGREVDLYYILGLDAILEIQTWKDYRDLFTLSHFVVLDRPGYDRTHLGEFLRREVHENFRELPGDKGFLHPSGYQVLFQETTLLDISGTQIRRLVREGRSVRYLLPEAVRRYILDKKLYL